jgi:hypothetical protein
MSEDPSVRSRHRGTQERTGIGRLTFRLQSLNNSERHPKIHFVLDFVQSLVLIGIVLLAVRAFQSLVGWAGTWIPGHEVPADLESYLPVVLTRWVVTVLDAVSMILIAIIGIGTVVKVCKEHFKRRK